MAETNRGSEEASDEALVSAGEIFIRRLAEHGVEYFFANAGTDFAPIIEAIARAEAENFAVPKFVIAPHETAAVGMAHGYYLSTGRPQAVMVHTNVGLANAVMPLINAATDQIPILMVSGLTPVTEAGRQGHRTTAVAWGQDMRDQAGMVYDVTKYQASLTYPEQMSDLVDRAMTAAMSYPRGPVYLALPREPLCQKAPLPSAPPRCAPARSAPHPDDVREAARLLDEAENPLIITHRAGHDEGSFDKLTAFAETHAIPVIEAAPTRLSLSGESPMHAGFDSSTDIGEADVILVLDTAVPWLPHRASPSADAKVIQTGPDPWHLRIPIRGFHADVTLAGANGDVIDALEAALPQRDRTARAKNLIDKFADRRPKKAPYGERLTAIDVSRAVAELAGETGRVVTELGARTPAMRFSHSDQLYANPISGGLGWGMTAALGLQLADRDRLVIATVGDGSYMFANPVACHQIAEANDLPILTIVLNNGIWNAVRASALGIYPDGFAARANETPLSSLAPLPDFCKVAEASRAWTARVETGENLVSTLEEAASVIREERRQALVEIRVHV